MTRLQPSGWNVRKFFAASLGQSSSDGSEKEKAQTGTVRLIDPPRRAPVTPIETRVVSALNNTGPVSFARLVKTVAADLYAEELRKGAGVLDIGLLGDRLFDRDIIRELKAGDGILWEIKPDQEIL